MTSNTIEDYENLTPREHVLQCPHVYGGNIDALERETYIYDGSTNCFEYSRVKSPGLLTHMFVEIIANAADNFVKTAGKKADPGSISIKIGYKSVTVRNEGEPIPLEQRKDGIYTPDMIFGMLFSGSNYNNKVEKSGTIGQNGIGAKLTNIFSEKFIVRCADTGFGNRKNNATYERTWTGNMEFAEPPQVILNNYQGKSYTEIEYWPDFSKFGKSQIDRDDFGLMAKYALELSFTLKIPITLNGEKRDYISVKNFSRLCFGIPNEKEKRDLKYVCVLIQDGKLLPDRFEKDVETGKLRPTYAIYFFDIPDSDYARIFSYVNGFSTPEGGCHVDKIIKKLETLIQNKYGVVPKHLADYLGMIVACQVVDPKYDGQTKYKLQKYKGSASKDPLGALEEVFDKIMRLDYFKNYVAELQKLIKEAPSKIKGKNEKYIDTKGGKDANYAGIKEKSRECTLMIVEGKSASAYADGRRTLTPNGPNILGYAMIRGKVLNVKKASQERIDGNVELTHLKLTLGIQETDNAGRRIDYRDSGNRKRYLRYGSGVLIISDPDSDGMHIACLLINFFKRIDGFIEAGLVKFLRPPLVRAYSGTKISHRFYDFYALEEFLKKYPTTKLIFEYFKGLGTCDPSLHEDDLVNALEMICEHDEKTDEAINVCFGKYEADRRKFMIARQRLQIGTIFQKDRQRIGCSEMIYRGMKDYNIDSFRRALPCNLDGLKESQRKILYIALKHWDYGEKKLEGQGYKTCNFASKVSDETSYLHGQTALEEALCEMAKNYRGYNNLNLIKPIGIFGNDKGAAHASPRYTHVHIEDWVKYAYSKEMVDLVPRLKSENKKIEPEWIPCDLPPYINPIRGIATGFSTFIPPHSAIDACDTVIYYCKHGTINGLKPILPYSEGFSRPFEVKNNNDVADTSDIESATEEEEEIDIEQAEHKGTAEELDTISKFINRKKGRRFCSGGILIADSFETTDSEGRKRQNFKVTELPYGYFAEKFEPTVRSYLLKESQNSKIKCNPKYKDVILGVRDMPRKENGKEIYEFFIEGYSVDIGKTEAYKFLKLERSYPMTMMNMITTEGIPKYYDRVEDIFNEWAGHMSHMYKLYKAKLIANIDKKIKDLTDKAKFMRLVMDEKIVPKRTKAEYTRVLATVGLEIDIMKKVNWIETSKEEIDRLLNEIKQLEGERDTLEKTHHHDIWRKRVEKLKEFLYSIGKTSRWEREPKERGDLGILSSA